MDDIAVPLLIITSLEDPLVPDSNIPYDIFTIYPHMILATARHGGHMAFLDVRPRRGRQVSASSLTVSPQASPRRQPRRSPTANDSPKSSHDQAPTGGVEYFSWADDVALNFLEAVLLFERREAQGRRLNQAFVNRRPTYNQFVLRGRRSMTR